MYKKIVNPETNRKVNIASKKGRAILEKYLDNITHKGGVLATQVGEAAKLRQINDPRIFHWSNGYDIKIENYLGWKRKKHAFITSIRKEVFNILVSLYNDGTYDGKKPF